MDAFMQNYDQESLQILTDGLPDLNDAVSKAEEAEHNLKVLKEQVAGIRKLRTTKMFSSNRYFCSQQINSVVKSMNKVRLNSPHHEIVFEAMHELVQFVGQSEATTLFALQRYYSEIIRVTEALADRQRRVDALVGWLRLGLNRQLFSMLRDHLPTAVNFFIRLIKLLGTVSEEQRVALDLEFLADEICLNFVMRTSRGMALSSVLQLLQQMLQSNIFLSTRTLIRYLEEGLVERLVEVLAEHTIHDYTALECIHRICKRLLRDAPQLFEVFRSELSQLNLETHIAASLILAGFGKKLKQTMEGWISVPSSRGFWEV